MKRKLYTMASVIMLILLLFTACSKKTVKLNTPTGLSTDTVTKMLSWTAVDNAVKYRVQIDSKTPEDSSGNTYSLSRLQEGIYHLKVQAIGDGKKFLDSDWSSPIAYVLGNFSMKISNKHGAYSLDENPSLAAEIKIGTSTVSGQKITWTSNNIDIALIDANTGNLTFKKPGLATVTALATINGNEVSDNYTFNVFKSLESKLYLNGLAFTNSGSGSNADGSFTYSADAPSEGTPTIRTVQSYGTGSDYSNATVGPIGRLVDDFCKAALSDTDKKLFLTVVLEHSIDNGPLIIRVRNYIPDTTMDYNFATHGGYEYAPGKRTMTFDLTEHWSNADFTAGLALMWEQKAAGSVTIYDAFLHTSKSMSDGEKSDGIFIQNSQLFRNQNNNNKGNGKYAGADNFTRLLSENGGRRQLTVGSFEDFSELNANNATAIWATSNSDIIGINSLTGEIAFKGIGSAYISVCYTIDNVVYGDKVLIEVPN